MFTFEQVVEENLYIVREMIRSNTSYYEAKYGEAPKKENELEFLASNKRSFLIKVEDSYIGLTSYTEHPTEKCVSIALLLIHADYQGFGYGSSAYYELEDRFIKQGYKKSTLEVSSENNRAKQFWERNGYIAFDKRKSEGIEMTCYHKQLSQI